MMEMVQLPPHRGGRVEILDPNSELKRIKSGNHAGVLGHWNPVAKRSPGWDTEVGAVSGTEDSNVPNTRKIFTGPKYLKRNPGPALRL